jgi:hypothetical protein
LLGNQIHLWSAAICRYAPSLANTSICSFDYLCCVCARHCNTETIPCLQLNLDRLLARMWEEMGLVRVYTKPQGQQPDFGDPVVLSTVCLLSLSRALHWLLHLRSSTDCLMALVLWYLRIGVVAQLKTSVIISIEACLRMWSMCLCGESALGTIHSIVVLAMVCKMRMWSR